MSARIARLLLAALSLALAGSAGTGIVKSHAGRAGGGEMLRWLSGAKGQPQAVVAGHGGQGTPHARGGRITREPSPTTVNPAQ